ncbi:MULTISPECIES: hypothetical protein [Pseudanabaena]|uniref:hypothetical protein n=1 Tax=Pseudanabaena TaxID=1152 RepID=UPI00247A3349|nr:MULTISPECIES: hypothetical protein [Pseudanabaena]MEA5485702.1 hypothetical protein [Pseudanabaena sp. CCNP1317]WGS72047.1 hypothetical protein OA858_20430 [Pseudanabaena galeata CCNP1313]
MSPNYLLEPISGEVFFFDKVLDKEVLKFNCQDKKGSRLIFEDRMQGWFFDPALNLVDDINSSVVAVHIVTPLIEALRCYILGKKPIARESSTFFKEQADEIFPLLQNNEVARNLLYKGVRCGFAHQGFLKDDDDAYNILILSEVSDKPIIFDGQVMTIHARKYVEKINEAYQSYFNTLDRDADKLNKFYDMWKHQWRMKRRHLIEISGT